MAKAYHATPFEFNNLRAGSWVSDSLMEACLHLLMKNVEHNSPDRLQGYVMTLHDFSDHEALEIIDVCGVKNSITRYETIIPNSQIQSLRDTIRSFPEHQQWLFHAEDIVDLKPFLKQ